MPEKTLNEVFSEIADAIREKSESSETIKPVNMATAIEQIPTGPQFHNTLVSFSDGDEYWSLEPYNPSFLVSKAAAEYSGNSSDVEVVGDYEGAGLYYYSTNTSPGTLTRLYSGYYDSDGNELDGLTGEGYYHFDGIDSFVDLGLNAGSGYYMQGDMPYPIKLPNNWDYAGGSIVTINLPYEEGKTYTYVNRDEGQIPFVSYTPGPTPEKGKYYYGNALNAQTLNSETLYWKGYGDNISLTSVNLTSGNVYKYTGDTSFYEVKNFPESYGWYYYGMSGTDEFGRLKLTDGLYQIKGANGYNFNLTANNYYQYTVNGQGRMAFTPYTPEPSGGGEAGHYYYGSTPSDQTLVADKYYLSEGSGSALVEQQFASGEYYEYTESDLPGYPLRLLRQNFVKGGTYFIDDISGSAFPVDLPEEKCIASFRPGAGSEAPGCSDLELTENSIYQYGIDEFGDPTLTPYTPSGSGEPGKYYYGTAGNVQAQTLAAGVYQFVDNNTAMTQFNLNAGSTYTWNGHSFLPYSETDALDMLMQETF